MIVNTPPMGWNTWNTFGEKINEALIMETADAMVDRGLLAAGYEYVVIDDCWSLRERDSDGNLVADPEKFPHGMKYLADYIHSKGMKFGIYSCCGPRTCAGYPGSFNHEYQDAKLFASWGVDFLKYDWCYHPKTLQGWTLYNRMRMALDATGRDILFSICNWGEQDLLKWARAVGGNMYRSTGDINDSFRVVSEIIDAQRKNMCLSGPSCFNDMDMLICGMNGRGNVAVGDNGCTEDEYRTHFALWCMCSAPLMLGCDVRNMSDETLKLVTDRELIAIDQDPECRPPIPADSSGEKMYAMVKHLTGGEYAFSITNFRDEESDYLMCWLPDIGLSVRDGYGFRLYDTENGEEIGVFTDAVRYNGIKPHMTKVFRGRLEKLV